MKSGGLRVAVQAAVLAVLMPAAGYAGELRDKIEYCTTCHGDHAQGVQAYFTAPRLAGQQLSILRTSSRPFPRTGATIRPPRPLWCRLWKAFLKACGMAWPSILANSILHPRATVLGDWSKQAGRFSRMAFRTRTFPHAPPVTGRMRMAAIRFRVWRVSFIPTPWRNLQAGLRDTGAKIPCPRKIQTPCSLSRPA